MVTSGKEWIGDSDANTWDGEPDSDEEEVNMMFYRCKCGFSQAHTSMGVPACSRCPKCGSDLAPGPNVHSEPEPHEFVTKYDQNTGAPYQRCKRCFRTQAELDEVARVEWPTVDPQDDGIRPAGRSDECFYCRSRVGQEHARDCTIVTKVIEMSVVVDLDGYTARGVWTLTVPHEWDEDMCNSHKNESSWCSGNILHERERREIRWLDGAEPWPVLEAHVAKVPKDMCNTCGHIRFIFVRVVDATPRRALRS